MTVNHAPRADRPLPGAAIYRRTPLAAAIGLVLAAAVPAARASLQPGAARGDAVTVIADSSAVPVKIDSFARARIAADAAGNYVVVWAGERDHADGTVSDKGIYLRRYDSAGKPRGDVQLLLGSGSSLCPGLPVVAMDATGDFVVAWEQPSDCTIPWSPRTVMAERFTSDGTPGAVYTVATNAFNDPPSVAMDAAGDFAVVWTAPYGAYGGEVRSRFYPVNSTPGSAVLVNTTTIPGTPTPSIAMDPAGDFVIAWQVAPVANHEIHARRFDSIGSPVDPAEFLVNAYTTGTDAKEPDVAMDAAGDFAVAWTTESVPSTVYARVYKAGNALTPAAPETVVVAPAGGTAYSHASVAMDPGGDAVAGAFAYGYYDSSSSVARFIDGVTAEITGAAIALPCTISGTPPAATSHCLMLADVAMDANGDALLLSTNTDQYGFYLPQYLGLTVRAYQGAKPTDLAASVKADDSTVEAGGNLGFSVAVDNLNPPSSLTGYPDIDSAIGAAAGISATLVLPGNAKFISAAGTSWNCSPPAKGRVTCNLNGLLAAGSSSTLDVQFTVPATADSAALLAAVDGLVYDPKPVNNYAAGAVGITAPDDPGNDPGGDDPGGNDGDLNLPPPTPAPPGDGGDSDGGGGAFGWLGIGLMGFAALRRWSSRHGRSDQRSNRSNQ